MERLSTTDLICAIADGTHHWETMNTYLDMFMPVEVLSIEEKSGLSFVCGNLLQKKVVRGAVVTSKVPFAMEASEILNAKYMGSELWMNDEMKDQAMAAFTRALPTYKFTTDKEKLEEQEMDRAEALRCKLEAVEYYTKYVLVQTFLRAMGANLEQVKAHTMRENLLFTLSQPKEKVVKEKPKAQAQTAAPKKLFDL